MSKIISKNRSVGSLRIRQNFSKIDQIIDIPNLIEVQEKSFESFMQRTVAHRHRKLKGLEEVFHDVFPISDLNVNAQIEYVGLEIGSWECGCGDYSELGGPGEVCDKCGQEVVYKEKHTLRECRQKQLTYSDPLRMVVRLVLFDREAVDVNAKTIEGLLGKYIVEDLKSPATGKVLFPARTEITPEVIDVIREQKVTQIIINAVREVKEQKIFLGELPMMSSNGTFMINGVERDPINHKRSIRTHHWQFAQKYFLLLNLPDNITDNLSNFLPSNHINHFWSNLSTRREKHLPRRGTLKILYNIFTQ
jgi:DNA-directed RNA polymerase subunit beta